MSSRWADWVTRYAGWCLLASCGITVLAFLALDQLRFESSYVALLPEDAPEVQQLELFEQEVGGSNELILTLSGGSASQRLEVGRRLVAAIEASPDFERADVELPTDFFTERALWLLPLSDLEELSQRLDQAVRDLMSGNPGGLHALRAFEERQRATHPDLLRSTFTSADGERLFVFVRPRSFMSDIAQAEAVMAELERRVAEITGTGPVSVQTAGRIPVILEENQVISEDMASASILAFIGIVLLLIGVTRQPAALLILGIPLIAGIVLTLACSLLLVDQLNLVSGFMIPVLLGLGVDFAIHIDLAFLRALHVEDDRRAAMRTAVQETLPPCILAGLTTAAAFFILISSTYQGISEYGLLAGTGILVMLAVTFVMVPPLAMFLSIRPARREVVSQRSVPLSPRFARSVLVVAALVTVAALLALPSLRFFNDFKALRGENQAEQAYDAVTQEVFGGQPIDPGVVLVSSLDDARRVEQVFAQHQAAQSDPDVPGALGRTLSLARLVPTDVERRRALLHQMAARLQPLPDRLLPTALRDELASFLALLEAEPWSARDVPDAFRRRLMSTSGDAYLVLAWPAHIPHSDAAITRWVDRMGAVMEEVQVTAEGAVFLDEHRVVAKMTELMAQDIPRMIAFSAVVVLILLIAHFREPRRVALAFAGLALGMLWMLGFMVAVGWALNLFNVVVLPTVVGIGIDNAVHILHGYDRLGRGSLGRVLATVGLAVALASLTTALGFGAMAIAHHVGIMMIGVLAVVGVSATFVATTVVVPSVLRVLENKKTPT